MKKIITLSILSLLLVSCATTKQYKKFTAKDEVPQDKARIYLIRTGNFGGFVKFDVYQNSKENQIGAVGPKSYLCFDAPIGENKIIVKAESEKIYTINAVAGKTYYLRLVPKMGVNKARVNFELLSNEDGIKETSKLKSPKMYYTE